MPQSLQPFLLNYECIAQLFAEKNHIFWQLAAIKRIAVTTQSRFIEQIATSWMCAYLIAQKHFRELLDL